MADKKKIGIFENLGKLIKRDFALIILVIPGFLSLLIFSYFPLYGILTAFQNYSPGRGIVFGAEWVGFKWFTEFFGSIFFWRLMRNTFLLSFYTMLATFPVPIIFALLLNEVRFSKYKRMVQSVSYLPHFISTVVIVGILMSFVGSDGIISNLVNSVAGERIQLLGNEKYFRTLYVSSEVWVGFGWDSIIYSAAFAAVDVQLYEAAKVDGAGRWKRLVHITMPAIVPVIVIQLILKMGSLFSVGAEKALLMSNPSIYETADIIATYVYRRGIIEQNYSFGVAVGLFNSLLSLVFVIATNYISRKTQEVSLW